jgi:hypothetical protein
LIVNAAVRPAGIENALEPITTLCLCLTLTA